MGTITLNLLKIYSSITIISIHIRNDDKKKITHQNMSLNDIYILIKHQKYLVRILNYLTNY
jgi:hypothetical protein